MFENDSRSPFVILRGDSSKKTLPPDEVDHAYQMDDIYGNYWPNPGAGFTDEQQENIEAFRRARQFSGIIALIIFAVFCVAAIVGVWIAWIIYNSP